VRLKWNRIVADAVSDTTGAETRYSVDPKNKKLKKIKQ